MSIISIKKRKFAETKRVAIFKSKALSAVNAVNAVNAVKLIQKVVGNFMNSLQAYD